MATFTDGQVLYASDLNALLDDTGWVDITGALRSGFTSSDLKARRVGDLVSIRGTVTGTIPVASTTSTTLGTIPSQFRPSSLASSSVPQFVSGGGFAPLFFRVQSSGSFDVFHFSGATREAVGISLTYMV